MVKGKVTHFEIPVDKMDRAKKFYAEAFGWNLMTTPGAAPGQEYVMAIGTKVDAKGMNTEVGAINGGIIARGKPVKNPVITIEVDDMDAAIEKIKKLGGKILMPKTSMAEMGFFGYFEDSEGNTMGLWQSSRRM
ncbi:MAG TPA: VOC family protein [Methanomassiliicoccales archaeon]|nr:VOC family protein [Methanomassiliicoccales archaeon]